MTVAVRVALDVAAPVMVAALGSRNEIVKVFNADRRQGNVELLEVQHANDIGRSARRCSFTGLITPTAALPLPSAATSRGATTKTNTYTATITCLDRPF